MSGLHPSGLNDKVVAKVIARRGRLHAFEELDPAKTALVIIDLNRGTVAQDVNCKSMIPRINNLAVTLRKAGGRVAWVRPDFVAGDSAAAVFGQATAERFVVESSRNNATLWPELQVAESDLQVVKRGASAFFPGKCELHPHLQKAGIVSFLLAGTVTNVCVESSARDAVELGYRVTLVSDACAGHSHGLHEATLNTFYRSFGDVRPVADVIRLLENSRAAA